MRIKLRLHYFYLRIPIMYFYSNFSLIYSQTLNHDIVLTGYSLDSNINFNDKI